MISALHPSTGARSALPESAAWGAFSRFGSQTLTLPIVSYGQPLGTVCLHRSGPEFALADLRWLGDVMHVPRSLTERAAEFGGAVSVTHRLECTEIVITLPLLGVLA